MPNLPAATGAQLQSGRPSATRGTNAPGPGGDMAAVDLADLLTPKTTVIPCAVAVALQAVDKQYREQLEAAIATCAATPPGRRGPIPQDNLIEAFARLGHRISVNKLHDHIRSRCTCG